MKCCGETVLTPFCSLCGKKNPDAEPLVTLLAYVRLQKKKVVSWADNLQEPQAGESDERRKRHAQRVAKKQVLIEKWESWAVALEAAINAKSPPETNPCLRNG